MFFLLEANVEELYVELSTTLKLTFEGIDVSWPPVPKKLPFNMFMACSTNFPYYLRNLEYGLHVMVSPETSCCAPLGFQSILGMDDVLWASLLELCDFAQIPYSCLSIRLFMFYSRTASGLIIIRCRAILHFQSWYSFGDVGRADTDRRGSMSLHLICQD